MAWFDRNNTNNEPGGTTIAPSFELTDEHIKKIADNVLGKLQENQGVAINSALEQNPILKRLGESMEAAERAKAERQRQVTQQQSVTQQSEFEQAYGEMDENTRKVVDDRFSQVNQRAMSVEARVVRSSVFEDQEAYEYYVGDIKKKVDDLLDAEPLSAQVNPLVVKNAYKVVLADHIKELQEKKLRSRLSGATGSSTSAGLGAADPSALPTLTNEEKEFATKMGLDLQDWAKSKKELIESGEIAGV